MIERPSAVMILGKEIQITYHRQIARGKLLGDFCEVKEQIRVVHSEHILHECLHAIIRLSGQTWMNEEQEEALVIALETGLKGMVYIEG